MGEVETTCVFIQDISEDESVCRKGFPTDVTCWTGEDSPCNYYSTYYEPDETNGDACTKGKPKG